MARGAVEHTWLLDKMDQRDNEADLAAVGEAVCQKYYGMYQRQKGGMMVL